MKIFLWVVSISGVAINALNIGLIWELGIRLTLGAASLPYSVCFWIALFLSNMVNMRAQKVSSEKEAQVLCVVNELVNPIVFFIGFGLIYFISRM